MSPFLSLPCARSFCLLHSLFRIDTEDQPHRHVIAVRQLRNYVRDFPWIAFQTAVEASQHLQERTDRGLILRQQVRRILNGAPCPVGPNTSRLQCADLDSEGRDFHRQRVAEGPPPTWPRDTAYCPEPRGGHRPKTPERCDRPSAYASRAQRRAWCTPRRKSMYPRSPGSPPHSSAR